MVEPNARIPMKRHPQGMVAEGDVEALQRELPALQPGEAPARMPEAQTSLPAGASRWIECWAALFYLPI